jgi:hypothetical protein
MGFEAVHLNAEGFADFGAEAAGGAAELQMCEEDAYLLDKIFALAQVDRATDAVVAVAEPEVRSEPSIAMFSPSGDD